MLLLPEVRNFKKWKCLGRNLNKKPGHDEIGDGNTVDASPSHFGEKLSGGHSLTSKLVPSVGCLASKNEWVSKAESKTLRVLDHGHGLNTKQKSRGILRDRQHWRNSVGKPSSPFGLRHGED